MISYHNNDNDQAMPGSMCVNFQPMMMMMMIIMMMMTTIIDDANDDDDDNNNNLVGGRDAGLYVCQLSTHDDDDDY